jgi:hypothetical protein
MLLEHLLFRLGLQGLVKGGKNRHIRVLHVWQKTKFTVHFANSACLSSDSMTVATLWSSFFVVKRSCQGLQVVPVIRRGP